MSGRSIRIRKPSWKAQQLMNEPPKVTIKQPRKRLKTAVSNDISLPASETVESSTIEDSSEPPLSSVQVGSSSSEELHHQVKLCASEIQAVPESAAEADCGPISNEDGFATAAAPKLDLFAVLCEICGKRFQTSERLKVHTLTHTKEKNFKCNFCPKTFPQVGCKTRHEKIVHSDMLPEEKVAEFECSWCRKSCPTESALTAHVRIHTGEKPFKCNFCSKEFAMAWNQRAHEKRMHGHVAEKPTRGFSCTLCSLRFWSQKKLDVHIKQHQGEKPYKCRFCDKTYGMEKSFKTHEAKKHADVLAESGMPFPVKIYECPICKKVVTSKALIRQHISLHNKEPLFRCKYCSKGYYLKRSVTKHENKVHVGGPVPTFQCSYCPRKFATKIGKNNHEQKICPFARTKTSDRQIETSTAGAGQPVDPQVLDEMQRIVGDPVVRAFLLDRLIPNNSSREYYCVISECVLGSSVLKSRGNLEIHKQIHANDSECYCSICEKHMPRTGSKSNRLLRRHFTRHVDVLLGYSDPARKYICSKCSKRFVTETNLSLHLKQHMRKRKRHKNKVYECEVCAKAVRSGTKHFTSREHLKNSEICEKNKKIQQVLPLILNLQTPGNFTTVPESSVHVRTEPNSTLAESDRIEERMSSMDPPKMSESNTSDIPAGDLETSEQDADIFVDGSQSTETQEESSEEIFVIKEEEEVSDENSVTIMEEACDEIFMIKEETGEDGKMSQLGCWLKIPEI